MGTKTSKVFFTIFTHTYTKVLEEIIPFLHFLDAWKFLSVKKKWQTIVCYTHTHTHTHTHKVKQKQYENTISKMLAWDITILPV